MTQLPASKLTQQTTAPLSPWWFIGCSVLYLLARVPGLMTIPLFNDEVIYLRWARDFPTLIWVSIRDGRLIHTLLLIPLVRLPIEPLLAGRLLSVLCGLGTLLLLRRLGNTLGHPVAGVISAGCYALTPFAVLHERLILIDSLQTVGVLALLLASLHAATAPQLHTRHLLIIGAWLGLTALVKASGLFFFLIPLVVFFMMTPTWDERTKRLGLLRRSLLVALVPLALLAPFHFATALYGFVDTPFQQDRFTIIGDNVRLILDWIIRYLPAPLLVPIGYALYGLPLPAPTRRLIRICITSALLLILSYIFLSVRIYSRYLLPITPLVLFAAALALVEMWRSKQRVARLLAIAALALSLGWGGMMAYLLTVNPVQAPLAADDYFQYVEGWTAGYGLDALIERIRQEQAAVGSLIVVNHARVRLVHVTTIYSFEHTPGIRLTEVELERSAAAIQQMDEFARQQPTYLVVDGEEYDLLKIATVFPAAHVVYYTQHPSGGMRFYLLRWEL